MTLPPDPSAPDQPAGTIARRRRARRSLVPEADARAGLVTQLARRAYPSYEFFLLAALTGAVFGLGYILDSQAVLLFGALLAPLMAPWVGLSLATVTGSVKIFFQTALAILFAGALIFLTGLLSGVAARIWMPLPLTNLVIHSRLWWPDLAVLAIAAALLAFSFVRAEGRPVLPSVALAYELFLPLSAAGFALGGGTQNAFPDGVLVFLTHLAWATLFGVATLAVLGFRPLTFAGYTVGTVVVLAGLVVLIALSGLGTAFATRLAWPTPVPSYTPEPPPTLRPTGIPAPSPTGTPGPTATATLYIPPTATPTVTITPQPTPVYALIQSPQGGGARLRSAPNGQVITTIDNGYLVQILPEIQEYNGYLYAHVTFTRNDLTYDGWILQDLLVTATPSPGW